MAKITVSRRYIGRLAGTSKVIPVRLEVQRTAGMPAGNEFVACVLVGRKYRKGKSPKVGIKNSSNAAFWKCGWAKNPRRAIGRALAKAARSTASRGGAFAGRRRKRRR